MSGRQRNHHQEKREEKNKQFDEDELQLKREIKPARERETVEAGEATRPPKEAETPTPPPPSAVEER